MSTRIARRSLFLLAAASISTAGCSTPSPVPPSQTTNASVRLVPQEVWHRYPEKAASDDRILRKLNALTTLSHRDLAVIQMDDWGGGRAWLFLSESGEFVEYDLRVESYRTEVVHWEQVCRAALPDEVAEFARHTVEVLQTCSHLESLDRDRIYEWVVANGEAIPLIRGIGALEGLVAFYYSADSSDHAPSHEWRMYFESWHDIMDYLSTADGCIGGALVTILIESSDELCE
ncbi:MAG: hypothetical protein ACTS3F_13355 [Phycisphaerales bacterium]